MQKITSFPFTYIGNSKLGKIFRPYVLVNIYSLFRKAWQPVEMIIDSGADYTLLPNKYAEILGINLHNDCNIETTLGVGGVETVYQYKGLKIKIGEVELSVPVAFLERNDVPPLLGRLDCIEKFKLVFEDKISVFEI